MSMIKAEKEQGDGLQLGVPGLGERLRSARLAKELDISKMAELIHLTKDMVDALERDDYSDMPARVFVRGYIRNYARTVDLPMDSIVAQFDALWPDEDAPMKITVPPRLASDGQSGKSWHRVMTWFVVLVLLVLFLTWWQGYLDRFIGEWSQRGGDPAIAPVEESASEPELGPGMLPLSVPAFVPPAEEASEPEPEPALGLAGAAPVVQPENEPASRTELDAAAPDEAVAASSGAAPLTIAPVQAGPRAEAESEAPVVAQEAGEPIEAAPAAEPVHKGVVLRFTENCWVDIRDSTRTFKLFGTMKRGTQRTLGGEPPYRVVLGNARGVQIEVDGNPYDLDAHVIANVARFSLAP